MWRQRGGGERERELALDVEREREPALDVERERGDEGVGERERERLHYISGPAYWL